MTFDIKQILGHPANQKLIAFLAQFHQRSTPEIMTPDQVVQPYMTLGTHPDLVERLWDQLTILLSKDCRAVFFNSPTLIRPDTGIVFGFAGGTHTYALRLPPLVYSEAMRAGAQRVHAFSSGETWNLDDVGEAWVFCKWFRNEEQWCLAAYEFAGA
jgi:hypothetical protein